MEIIIYIFIGIIAGIFGAKVAKEKGQNSAIWFIVCFIFPIALVGLYLFLDNDIRSCPYCGEKIKKTAIKCRFCHSEVESTKEIEQKNTNLF